MSGGVESGLAIRAAVAADLPDLQQVYRAAPLSNAGDAPMLLARPEFLVFTGEGIAAGRTLVAVASPPGKDQVVGFATIATGDDDGPELEDLFVDPDCRRRGIARHLADTSSILPAKPVIGVCGSPATRMRWPSTLPLDSSRPVRSPPRSVSVCACPST
jgi:GNAT superfamily N-acetyltransferase